MKGLLPKDNGGGTGWCWRQLRRCGREGRHRTSRLLVLGLLVVVGALHSSCDTAPGTRRGGPQAKDSRQGVPSAEQEIEEVVLLFDAEGFISPEDEEKAKAVLGSHQSEKMVRLLEGVYRGSRDSAQRVRVLAALHVASGLNGITGAAEQRMRALAKQAVLDENPRVAGQAVMALWPWGDEADVKRLVRSRIGTASDPRLLQRLFIFLDTEAATVLLAELERPIPQRPGGLQEWCTRARIAMESCRIYHSFPVPAALPDRLVTTIQTYPSLADAAVRCLARLDAKAVVPSLARLRDKLPLQARDAVDAALAVLDPSTERSGHMRHLFAKAVQQHSAGSRPATHVVHRCEWVCYVAARTRDESLGSWLIDVIRAQSPKLRDDLLDRFIWATSGVPHIVLLGLNRCADEELHSLLRARPELADRLSEALVHLQYDGATPETLRRRLGPVAARLANIMRATDSGAPAD